MGWGVEHRLAATVACAAVLASSAPAVALGAPAADPAGCAVVATLVASGDLDDATTIAAALDGVKGPVPEVDARRTCPEAMAQTRTRREAASNLVARAKTTADPTTKALLASAAHTLDGDNAEATALVGTAKTPARPTLCAAAEQATARGEFARARAVYDALEDVEAAKKCREEGLVALTAAEQADPATVVTNLVSEDLLPTLLLLLVAFVLGAWLTSWWRWSFRWQRLTVLFWSLLLTTVGVVLVVTRASAAAPPTAKPSDGDPSPATLKADDWWSAVPIWLAVAAVVAAVLGFVVANVRRDRLPVTIEITGDSASTLAARVVDEISTLGGDGSAGTFVPKGTDVSDSGLAGALAGGTSNTLVKVLLSVWNLVRLRVSDCVAVALTTEKGSPASAVVTVRSGPRLRTSATVDGRMFCVDADTPTATELASTQRDVATAVASVVLLSRLGRGHHRAGRLYGATDARSLALCVVAARRLEAEELKAARELYEAAIDRDGGNLMARYGAIAARLRAYPGPTESALLVRQLDTLEEELGGAGTSSGTESTPLVWRLWWLRAAARANTVLAKARGWHDLVSDDSLAVFAQVDGDLVLLASLGRGDVHEPDRLLADKLARNALLAQRAVRRITSSPPTDITVDDLLAEVVVGDRGTQFTAACTLAVQYAAAAHTARWAEAGRLAEECVGLVESAGGAATWRTVLLDDPFLGLVERTAPFRALKAKWTTVTTYDGVASFGHVAGAVAAVYPKAAQLVSALADPKTAKSLAVVTGLRRPPLQEWAGAASWLARGQSAEVITLYQAAGLPDAAAVRGLSKSAEIGRLRGAMPFVGATELPDKATRAAMRRA